MDNSTKEAWTSGKNLSPEALEKRKKINKKILKYFLITISIIILIIIIAAIFSPKPVSPEPELTPMQKKAQKIEAQFDTDGSHIELTKYIKDNMNNPNSFEHIKTVYSINGDILIVTTEFRGSNAFGGIVKNSITATIDLNGKILEIVKW